MPAALDDQMQTASQALAELDYARCEALCVQALEQARAAQDWVMVRRVLLPLQEARRQKRQTAIDGLILLGTPQKQARLEDLIADERCGCVVLTRPNARPDALELVGLLRAANRSVEVLYADNESDAADWRVATISGPDASALIPAPSVPWVGDWVDPLQTPPPTPAHWFMRASEALGDAALASIAEPQGTLAHFDALAAALAAVGDHEILHQRLADAAKALHGASQ